MAKKKRLGILTVALAVAVVIAGAIMVNGAIKDAAKQQAEQKKLEAEKQTEEVVEEEPSELEATLFFASDYFIGTMTFLEHRKTSSDETINKYVDHHYKGQFISTPQWISGILKFDISNALQSNIIEYLREGKIPVNEARYLFRLFYEGK